MWKPICPGDPEMDSRIHLIAAALKDRWPDEKRAGLLTGLAGIAIFFAMYDKYTGREDHGELIEELLSSAFGTAQTTWHPVTFCSGVPGMLWAAGYLNETGSIELEPDTADTDSFLLEQMFESAEENDFDFLHGATGVLNYFICRSEGIDDKYTGRFISLLQKHAVVEADGSVSWESIVDRNNPRVVKNLSLSHGMSSIITILSIIHKKNPHPLTAELLRGAVKFVQSSGNKPGLAISLFPGYVEKVQPDAVNSRLGWCYGDLGIALALRSAGQALNDPALAGNAYDILRHSATRRDVAVNSIFDAGLCHGSAGIAHIFNTVYQETGEPVFKEAALYWLKHALGAVSEDAEAPAGYQSFSGENGWKNELSILEGIAGIGLAYIAATSDIQPSWNRCLLIS